MRVLGFAESFCLVGWVFLFVLLCVSGVFLLVVVFLFVLFCFIMAYLLINRHIDLFSLHSMMF